MALEYSPVGEKLLFLDAWGHHSPANGTVGKIIIFESLLRTGIVGTDRYRSEKNEGFR